MQRLPADVVELADHLCAELGRRRGHHGIGAGGLHGDHLAVDGGIRHLIGDLLDHQFAVVGTERVLEADQVVLPEVVVLIDQCDLGVGRILEDVFGVDLRFRPVARGPPHRPREVLGVTPFIGAGGDEQLRHFLLVHVALDGGVLRRAERVEQEGHLVLLHETAHLLDCLGRGVAVIERDEIDLAAGDATLVIEPFEERDMAAPDRAIS